MKLVIGTRGSRLAMVQTEMVAVAIGKANSGLEVSTRKIVTAGDRDRVTQLDQMGINIFVKELEEALLDRRIDIAVHSLKDMPTDIPEGLRLLAVMPREDPRDVLVAKSRLIELPPGAKIGTGSLRRSVQLAQCRPDLQACGIRGNVDTRLRKASDGEVDGIILAAAGLSRLGLKDRILEYLPVEGFLPAVGQGAIAIEARADDADITSIVAPLNHLPTWQSILAERAFLKALGGGCRAPIAALGTVEGKTLKLEGMAGSVASRKVLRGAAEGSVDSPEELGVGLAKYLLGMGADKFIAEVNHVEDR